MVLLREEVNQTLVGVEQSERLISAILEDGLTLGTSWVMGSGVWVLLFSCRQRDIG